MKNSKPSSLVCRTITLLCWLPYLPYTAEPNNPTTMTSHLSNISVGDEFVVGVLKTGTKLHERSDIHFRIPALEQGHGYGHGHGHGQEELHQETRVAWRRGARTVQTVPPTVQDGRGQSQSQSREAPWTASPTIMRPSEGTLAMRRFNEMKMRRGSGRPGRSAQLSALNHHHHLER
jgi:hypothetical protein